MTLKQMLSNMDSRELTDRMILDDIEGWKKRLAQKDNDTSQAIMKLIAGKAIAKGAVTWKTGGANGSKE